MSTAENTMQGAGNISSDQEVPGDGPAGETPCYVLANCLQVTVFASRLVQGRVLDSPLDVH